MYAVWLMQKPSLAFINLPLRHQWLLKAIVSFKKLYIII
jgi:hypothetical protein